MSELTEVSQFFIFNFQTICTTIGYGHLYPSTTTGRIFTMLYAIVGIPLVLSILDDLGSSSLYRIYNITKFCEQGVRLGKENR